MSMLSIFFARDWYFGLKSVSEKSIAWTLVGTLNSFAVGIFSEFIRIANEALTDLLCQRI